MLFAVLTAAAVLGGVGAILLIVGLVGRRVGDHPHCRRCGFDLFGSPGAAVCGECGGDLKGRRAVRIGQRRKRGGTLAAGRLLLAPAALLASVIAWGTMRDVKWVEYAPAWWLVRDIRSDDAERYGPALDELLARQAVGELSEGAVKDSIAAALDVQGDLEREWDKRYGDLLEQAHRDGKLAGEDLERYLVQGFGFRLEIRPDIRQGEHLPMQLRMAKRFGSRGGWEAFAEVDKLELGGQKLGMRGVLPRLGITIMSMGSGQSYSSFSPGPIELEPGSYKARAHIRMTFGSAASRQGGGLGPPMSDNLANVLAARNVEAEVLVRIRGADEQPNIFTMDPALREEVEALVSVSAVKPAPNWVDAPWVVEVRRLPGSPVPVMYTLMIVGPDGEEVRATGGQTTQTQTPAGEEIVYTHQLARLPELDASRKVTVILRPNESAAANRTDGQRPWGHDIVFGDIPVMEMPVSRPTAAPPETRWHWPTTQPG